MRPGSFLKRLALRLAPERPFERWRPVRGHGPAAVTTQAPLVSVVMTSYNTADYLQAAARSILSQTWRHLELLIVDDGSTDDSWGIAQALRGEDPRVRAFRLGRNCGTYPAKNFGIRRSRGDIVTFMDSDDVSLPERIERQLMELDGAGIVACTCDYARIDQSGRTVMNRGLPHRRALISLMLRRGVFNDVGWFDWVRLSADEEFFERVRVSYGRDSHRDVKQPLYLASHRRESLSTTEAGNIKLNRASEDPGQVLSASRLAYADGYKAWHARTLARGRRPYMPYGPLDQRPFPIDASLLGGAIGDTE